MCQALEVWSEVNCTRGLTAEPLEIVARSSKPRADLATLWKHARKNKVLLHLFMVLEV
jgi:hypothetical protein